MKEKLERNVLEFLNESKKLIEQHEKFKVKWLDLTISDLFDWIALKEQMQNMITEGKSMFLENKNELKSLTWKRMVELKSELTEDWKKKYTDTTAEWTINQEFKWINDLMNELNTYCDLLSNPESNIESYVNLVKFNMKLLNPMQWL